MVGNEEKSVERAILVSVAKKEATAARLEGACSDIVGVMSSFCSGLTESAKDALRFRKSRAEALRVAFEVVVR